jgi:diguanylate cyclase
MTNTASLREDAKDFFQYLIRPDDTKVDVDGPDESFIDPGNADTGLDDLVNAIKELFAAVGLEFSLFGDFASEKLQPGAEVSLNDIIAEIRQLTPPLAEQVREASVPSVDRLKPEENEDALSSLSPAKDVSWLARRMGRSQRNSSGEAVNAVESISPTLQTVIEHIHVLDMQSERSRLVKIQLLAAESLTDVQSVLESILQLIIDVAVDINLERENNEHFLNNIRRKLNRIEGDIVSIMDVEQSSDNANQIETDISQHMSDIGSILSESDNLDTLKGVVSDRIDALSGQLSDYLDKERRLLGAAQSKVGQLSSEMQVMGAEIKNLQSKVSEKQIASVTDALTGVGNRAGFDQKILEEIAESRRNVCPLSLMFLDVDRLKELNDTFGHIAGDTVLKTIATVINKRIKGTDYIARYGGDEFVVILPNTEIGGAKLLADDLLDKVRNTGFHRNGAPVNITLSIGIAEVRRDDTAESVVDRADQALYLVKESGRDGVQIAGQVRGY